MTTCTSGALDHILRSYRLRRFQGINVSISRRLAAVEHATLFGLTVMEANARLDYVLLNRRKKLIMGIVN